MRMYLSEMYSDVALSLVRDRYMHVTSGLEASCSYVD